MTTKKELVNHTKNVLRLIAERFDLDYDDMYNLTALEFQFDRLLMFDGQNAAVGVSGGGGNIDNNDATCRAFIKNKCTGAMCRCSRNKTTDKFCLTHDKQFKGDALKYGYDKQTKTTTTIQEVTKITVKDVEYLYQPLTRKVYNISKSTSFPSFVGYLSEKDNDIELIFT
jgi:hypothetical protein